MLATAAERPDALVIGIDASADSMLDASRRAGRSARRGGLPNARFVVAAAEALPPELDGCADALTVHFPWGSLLRGLLDADPQMLAGIARITRPGGTVTILLSVTEHDRSIASPVLDERSFAALAPRFAAYGLLLCEARLATPDDIARAHSTWAKRLGAGASRPAWLARFQRACTSADPGAVQLTSNGAERRVPVLSDG